METFVFIVLLIGAGTVTYFIRRIHEEHKISNHIDGRCLALALDIVATRQARKR